MNPVLLIHSLGLIKHLQNVQVSHRPRAMLIHVVSIPEGYDLNPTLYWGERGK